MKKSFNTSFRALVVIWVGIVSIFVFFAVAAVMRFADDKGQPDKFAPTIESKPRIVTTIYPYFFLAQELMDQEASVHNLIPAGVEPHDFEPTAQDIIYAQEADVLIWNGAGLDTWVKDIPQRAGQQRLEVTSVVETLQLAAAHEEFEAGALREVEETAVDPHVWLDPVRMQTIATAIADALSAANPERTNVYAQHLQQVKDKLQAFDGALTNCKKKDIVTSHAAFGYLANRYGLRQVPIAGLSPDAEPSPKELVELTKFVQENNVEYIFAETLVSPKLSQTIAHETGAEILELNPIEGLREADRVAQKDYYRLMQQNVDNLKLALQCP